MKLVETIRIIYKELFTVNFDHSAYDPERNILLHNELTIQPDETTQVHFKNYDMDYRFSNSTLVCFVRSNLLNPPAAEPKVVFKRMIDDLRIRFLLTAGTAFINKTEIVPVGSQQVYYFSNRVNAGTGMFISSNTVEVGDTDLQNVAVVEPGGSCLGVIDVFSSNAMNNNYELFTGSPQQLRSPAYRVRFRSNI